MTVNIKDIEGVGKYAYHVVDESSEGENFFIGIWAGDSEDDMIKQLQKECGKGKYYLITLLGEILP